MHKIEIEYITFKPVEEKKKSRKHNKIIEKDS